MTYGVVREGFVRKSLPIILAELEEAMIAEFGPDVIQTSQSPLGQLNGLFSDQVAEFWETSEDTYQSFDVDQANGPRLDMLAKLRRLSRNVGESDSDFRLRITNQGQADIKLTANINRLRAIEGVIWAHAIENPAASVSDLGMPPHSVAYAVIGGDDEDVAAAIFQQSVPGVALHGNTGIQVSVGGYCRTVAFIRPEDVPIRVEIDVKHIPDACNCAPPSIGTITQFLIDSFAGECGYKNGDTVLADRVAAEAARLGDLKIIDVRIARVSNSIVDDEIETSLFERPVIISPYVVVRYV